VLIPSYEAENIPNPPPPGKNANDPKPHAQLGGHVGTKGKQVTSKKRLEKGNHPSKERNKG